MTLRDDILQCYHENPLITGEQIRQKLHQPNSRKFWHTLTTIQIGIRGVYPGKRKNRNRGPVSGDFTHRGVERRIRERKSLE